MQVSLEVLLLLFFKREFLQLFTKYMEDKAWGRDKTEREREREDLGGLPFSILSFGFTASLPTALPGFSDSVPTAAERVSLVLHGLSKGSSGSLVGRQLGFSRGFRANLFRLCTLKAVEAGFRVQGLGSGV